MLLHYSVQFLRICFIEAAAGYRQPLFSTQASEELPDFMNGPIKQMLGIIPPEVTWRTSKLSSVVYDLCKTKAITSD